MRHHVHALVLTDRQVLVTHARWMTWNLLLAVAPLALSLTLFRPGRRQGFLWWTGVAVFVGFLPNAPYVLTDVIHLVNDVRHLQHPSALVFGLLPLYGVFFIAGLACYVAAVGQLRRYLRMKGRSALIVPSEACLYVLTAVGIFLGRFDRLNSWDILSRPYSVVSALYHLLDARPLITVCAALLVVAGSTVGSLAVAQRIGTAARSLRPRIALF